MGCCCSKKRKNQEDGQAPLIVHKDTSKFPEETNSTQYSNSEKNPKQAQKTDKSAKTTPTEHGRRSLAPSKTPKNSTSKDNKELKKKHEAVQVTSSVPKEGPKFPEDTDSTQTNSDKYPKHVQKSNKSGKTPSGQGSRSVVPLKTAKSSVSISDYKEWRKKMRKEFPETTEKTQTDDEERE